MFKSRFIKNHGSINEVAVIIHILHLAFAALFVLFLPGFVLSFVFFRPKEIEIIGRFALSFALSMAIVPLTVFYITRLSVKLTAGAINLEILAIILVSAIIIWSKHLW